MNTQAEPKPQLRLFASYIGPIMNLDQNLSSLKQNLIFARNGTGKSFIARALRMLDPNAYPSVQQTDLPNLLVSEEAVAGEGAFELYEGNTCVASLRLNNRTHTLSRVTPEYIFHVFTEDYIDEQIRNQLENLDGEITHEIIIGRENVELDHKETALRTKIAEQRSLREALQSEFANQCQSHKNTFSIFGSLGAFKKLNTALYFESSPYSPDSAAPVVSELLSQYNRFKSLPADPVTPSPVTTLEMRVDVEAVRLALKKVTSPSTVAPEFKRKLEADPHFFEAGLKLHKVSPNKCPFCMQPLQDIATAAIDAYQTYFDDEEAQEKEQLDYIRADIARTCQEIEDWRRKYHQERSAYDELRNYFPSFANKPLRKVDGLLDDLGGRLKALGACVEEKSNDLEANVEMPTVELKSANDALAIVTAENTSLIRKLSDTVSVSDSERKKIQRLSCESFERDFFNAHKSEIEKIGDLEADCEVLSREIEQLKLAHGNAAPARDRVVQTFSRLLERFFGERYTFDGQAFKVQRNHKDMRRGSDRTLSDGEKAAMAFCYFLSQVHLRVSSVEDYKKVYFVFDDPVTSMSFDYVYEIVQCLKLLRITGDGDIQFNLNANLHKPKMLILTHNTYFYNVASTNSLVNAKGLFQLIPGPQSHSLASQEGFATPHALHLRDVRAVSDGTKTADHTTPNSIRAVVEGIWRFCRPDLNDFGKFVEFLISEHQMEIRSVLINDLSHGGKFADYPHDEEDVRRAAQEAVRVVETFAAGQLGTV